MKLKKYQKLALRTAPEQTFPGNLLNVALGLCGESGEFAERVKKYVYHEHAFSITDLKKELGDILWYLSYASHILGVTLEDIAEQNLAKLKHRYPQGFSPKDSKARVDTLDETPRQDLPEEL